MQYVYRILKPFLLVNTSPTFILRLSGSEKVGISGETVMGDIQGFVA